MSSDERPHTPTEAYKMGLCPSCLGSGWTNRVVPVEHDGPCSSCGGDGTLAGMESHQDFLWGEA